MGDLPKIKLLLYYPSWENRWIPYIRRVLRDRFDLSVFVENETDPKLFWEMSSKSDVLLSMWCSDAVRFWVEVFPDKKIVTFLRRYELWEPEYIGKIDFSKVNALIFVAKHFADMFIKLFPKHPKIYVIPNGIDIEDFPFHGLKTTCKIALVSSMRDVKNIPLAAQLLMELPEGYSIHHIGINSNLTHQIISYFNYLGLKNRYTYEGKIPSTQIAEWLSDKQCLLSTSICEGNPNSVIEGMACGVKPVIHGWPGSLDQFPRENVFRKVSEAVNMITDQTSYHPESYREFVKKYYSVSNFDLIPTVISEVMSES